MADNLHFVITADANGFNSAIDGAEKSIDGLQGKMEELKYFFKDGLHIDSAGIEDAFRNFSVDEYIKELEKFKQAGGDLATQYEELWGFIGRVRNMAFDEAQKSLDWKRVPEELKAIYDNVVAAVAKLGREVVQIPIEVTPATGVGKNAIMSKEEIEQLEQARNKVEGEWYGITEAVSARSRETGKRTVAELTKLIEETQQHLQGINNAGALDESSFKGIFELHKNAAAGTQSIEELENALAELKAYTTSGESVAESYRKQREELTALLTLQQERARVIKSASSTEKDPDKKNALAEQAEQAQREVEQTRNQIAELSAQHARLLNILEDGQATAERYSQVLNAATDAASTDSVAELSRKLQDEEQQMRDTAAEIENLTQKLSACQAVLEKDNLSETKENKTIDNIERLQEEIDELSAHYQTLSDRAARYRYERDKAMEEATRERPVARGTGDANGGGNNPPNTPPSDDWEKTLKGNKKEIKSLSKELETLKEKADELAQGQSKITSVFDSYRGANAAAMSIRELNRANDEISDGFKGLSDAQQAYKGEIENLETTIGKQKENLAILAQAQKEALANGDNREAANLLKQYAETEQQIKSNEAALEELQTKYQNLQVVIDNNADVQERYKATLDAKEIVAAGQSVDELNRLYEQEVAEMRGAVTETENFQSKISDLQAQIASSKMSPQGIEQAKNQIEQYRQKISEFSQQYQIAADRASVFGKEIGKSTPQTSPVFSTKDTNESGKVGKSIKGVGDRAKKTATQLGKLRVNVTSITRGFSAMSKGGSGVITGLAGIGKGVMGLSAQLMTLLANPFVAIIAAIAAALMVLYKIVTNFISKTSDGANMFATWTGYIKGFKAAIEQFTTEVSRKVAEFVKNFGSFGSSIGAPLKVAWTFLSSWGTEIINFFSALGDGLKNYLTGKISDIGGGIKNEWTKIKAFFKGEEVKEEDLVDTNAADGAFDGFKKAIADFGKTAKSEVGASIDDMKAKWQEFTSGFSKFEMPSFKEFMNTYARIEQLQRGIIKKQREWTVASAQLEQQQAELQDQLSRAGNVDKLQTLSKLQDTIQKKYDGELSIARDELKVQQEINRLKGKNVSDDDLKKEADLTAKVLGIENKRTNEIRSLKNQHTDLTRQLEEERREQMRVLANNARDKQIAELQQQLKYEKDVTKQLELQDQIRKKQLEKTIEGIDKQQQGAIKSALGAGAEQAFANGTSKDELKAMFGNNEEAQLEIERLFQYYDKLREDARAKSEREGAFADYDKDYQAYMTYAEKVIAAEEWKQEELRKIAVGESNMTEAQVEKSYQSQIGDAAKYANLDAAELKLTDIAKKFQSDIADATFEGIENAIEELKTSIEGENNLINSILGMTDEQKAARTEELKKQIAPDEAIGEENQAVLNDENATPEERAAAEQAIAEAEERMLDAKREILLLSYDQQQLEGQRIKNQEVLDRMTQQGINAQKSAGKLTQEQMKTAAKSYDVVAQSLQVVKDAADEVADVFGGTLSKKSKKALSAISDIASIGMTSISGIESLVSSVNAGIWETSASGVSAIQALERASFILTVISMAIQVITAIVKVFQQFTTAARMQDAIDAHLDKVKQLEYEHGKLERAYNKSVGTDYYKGLAKSAKDYDKILQENNQALKEAQELYEYQKNKHGEDSDKAKEALEQVQDIEQQGFDYEDAQAEQFQELMEGLSGTSLESFSQNLADALVDGFAQGRDSIDDIWEDTMDDLMRTMMKQQLALALTDMFKPVFDELQKKTTAGGDLTQQEIDEIMTMFDETSDRAKSLANAYYDMMSERGLLDDEDAEGSQGFGQMTQDQADTLTARFTALQMEGANLVAISQLMLEGMTEIHGMTEQQTTALQNIYQYHILAFQLAQERLDQLQIIADNTSLLSETNTRLKAIEQNTDKL